MFEFIASANYQDLEHPEHCWAPVAGALCCCDTCCTIEPGWGKCATHTTRFACLPCSCVYFPICVVGWCATLGYCCHCGFKFGCGEVVLSWLKLLGWCILSTIPCFIPKKNFAVVDHLVYKDTTETLTARGHV